MFARELSQAGHTRRFVVSSAQDGWEVRIEQDSAIISRMLYNDWHRVERRLMGIAQEVSELELHGWTPHTVAC